MIPIYLAILAAALAVVGALYQYNEKLESDAKADSNQAKADTANAKLLVSQEAMINEQKKSFESQQIIIDEQKKTNGLAEQLNEANLKIIRLNEEVNSKAESMIGIQNETIKRVIGDGYAIIKIRPISDSKARLVIENASNYTLFDVAIAVTKTDQLKNKIRVENSTVSIDRKDFLASSVEMPEVTLRPQNFLNTDYTLNIHEIPINLLIKIHYRHCTTLQYIKILSYKDKFLGSGSRIFEVSNDANFKFLYSDSDIPDSEYEKDPFYKKAIIVDGFE